MELILKKFHSNIELSILADDFEIEKQIQISQLEIERLIELYAFLCKGRNYHNSKIIRELFPLEDLIEQIYSNSLEGPDLSIGMKASLLLILMHVHIDSKPFLEQKKPQLTKLLDVKSQMKQNFNFTRQKTESKLKEQYKSTYTITNIKYDVNNKQNTTLNQQLLTQQSMYDQDSEQVSYRSSSQIKGITLGVTKQSRSQSVELQSLGSQNEQTLHCLMIQGYEDLKIRNILKNLTKFFHTFTEFSSETSEYMQTHQELKNQIQTEVVRNLIQFMDIKHDNSLQSMVEFIQKANNISDFEQFDEYIKQHINDFLPQTYNDDQTITKLNMDNFLFGRKLNSKTGMDDFVKNILIDKICSTQIEGNVDDILKLLLLKLMFTAGYQQYNLIKGLHQIQVLSKEEDKQLFKDMQQQTIQLTFDCEQSEIWLDNPEAIRQDNFQYKGVIQRVIQNLQFFIKALKSDNHHEKAEVLKKQIMIRNLETHIQVQNLLKEAIYILKQIQVIHEDNQLILDLFISCFDFLYYFVYRDNIRNKNLISQHLDFFISNLELVDVGQCKLICQLFKNNPKLIKESLNEKLLQLFLYQLVQKSRYHSRYLELFYIAFENTDEVILLEQHTLQNLLFLDQRYKNNQSDSNLDFDDVFDLEINKYTDLNEKQPYIYQITCLKMILKLIKKYEKSKNAQHKQKLEVFSQQIKNVLPLENLFKVCLLPDIFNYDKEKDDKYKMILNLHLKHQVFELMKKLWGNSTQTYDINSDIEQFEYIIEFYEKENDKIFNKIVDLDLIYNEGYKTDKKEQSMLQQLVLHQTKPNNVFQNYNYYSITYIFPIVETLSKMKYSKQVTENLKPLKKYVLTFQQSLLNFDTDHLQKNYENFQETIISLEQIKQKSLIASLPQTEFYDNISNYYIFQDQNLQNQKILEYNFENPMAEMLMSQTLNEGNWREVILHTISSKQIHQKMKEERQQLTNIILSIDDQPKFMKIIQSLMQFVVEQIDNQSLELELFQEENEYINEVSEMVIDLLRNILENAHLVDISKLRNHKIDKKDIQKKVTISVNNQGNVKREKQQSQEDQELQQWYYHRGQKFFFQNKFKECGLVQMVIQNLCNFEIEKSLFIRHIKLANSLLAGGNTEVQNAFYDYFLNVNSSENLFERIYQNIEEETNRVKQIKTYNDILNKCIDNLTILQVDESQYECEQSITQILRFIQLLSEGHKADMQNYMRIQENSRNNFNILNSLVKLSEALFQNLSDENYFKLNQCLITIAELTQGPCIENQQFLAQSQLIQMSNNLLQTNIEIHNYNTKDENQIKQNLQAFSKNHRQIQIHRGPNLSDIYQKKSQKILKIRYRYQMFDNSLKIKDILEIDQNKKNDAITDEVIAIQNWINQINRQFGKLIGKTLVETEKSFEPWMIRRLQDKVLICLESILEGNQDNEILIQLSKQITLKTLIENIKIVYDQYNKMFRTSFSLKYNQEVFNNYNPNLRRPQYTSELIITNGFKLYSLVKGYTDMSDENGFIDVFGTISNDLGERFNFDEEGYYTALQFFSKYTGYVEVSHQQQLFKVYFPKLPFCTNSNEDYRNNFDAIVDRSSTKTKLTSLMKESQNLINQMKFQQSIKEFKTGNFGFFGKMFSFLAKRVPFLRVALFLICVVQNIVLLSITQEKSPQFKMRLILNEPFGSNSTKILLVICEFTQIICSLIIFLLYIAIQINKGYQDMKNPRWRIRNRLPIDLHTPLSKGQLLRRNVYLLKIITSESDFYAYLFYFICTILGLFNFAFIAILLLDIFFLSPVLQTILKSIWRPRKQIFLTLVLLLIVQYLFSVIAYYGFSDEFSGEKSDGSGVGGCNNLLVCWSTMFDSTFKFDGGFTGLFGDEVDFYIDSDFVINSKAIYDFMYNFIILVLVVQMLSGIIIDTFGELRQENDEKVYDKRNFCFICGLNRRDLDQQQGLKFNYNEHILKRHNVWNYLFYIAYVKEKPETELTGIESYVYECQQTKDISWFPLDESQNEDEEQILEELNKMSENMENLNEQVEKMQKQKEKNNFSRKQFEEIGELKQNMEQFNEKFEKLEKQNSCLIELLQKTLEQTKTSNQ